MQLVLDNAGPIKPRKCQVCGGPLRTLKQKTVCSPSCAITIAQQRNTKGLVTDVGRECAKCGEFKEWGEFYAHTKGLRGKRSLCKKCQKGQISAKYGIDEDAYSTMLGKQNGVCAICGRPETAKGRWGSIKRLSIDHSHITGAVRGLLCTKCNAGLGHFSDSVKNLKAAIDYLKEHADNEPPQKQSAQPKQTNFLGE